MIITSLKLDHFRNYETLELEPDPGINLFYGDNAQGKTNILEAVFLAGTTKSHRPVRDREMIMFDSEEAHIRMMMRKNESSYRVDMHLKKNRAKGIAVNAMPVKKAGDLIGIGHFVFFSPEDLNIIKNGPAERRRFLDMELCQLSRLYVSDLMNYHRVLMQRNQLLKDIPFHPDLEGTLDVWDEQLVRYGRTLIRERERFCRGLHETAAGIHSSLTGGKEKLKIRYEPNVSEDQFASLLAQRRETDIRMKTTGTGPHRDDLMFAADGIDVRKYGSQGQQRTTALSLKLSEIELVRNLTGDPPVLLLDDVLSELDQNRQSFLLSGLDKVQTFITCTGMEDFHHHRFTVDRLFHVVNGSVTRE